MNHWDVPAPYPDELSYSIVARHLRNWGYQLRKEVLKAWAIPPLLSTKVTIPSGGLGTVKGQHPARSLNTKTLLQHHTLVPYYLCFEPQERRKRFLNEAAHGAQPTFRTPREMWLRQKYRAHTFRFCPACVQEDCATYGEPYWHRHHQLPGVTLCTLHDLSLHQSSVSNSPQCPLAYVAASQSNCRVTRHSLTNRFFPINIARSLAFRSAELLKKPLGRPAIISVQGYRELARLGGYAQTRVRLNIDKIDKDFVDFLGIQPELVFQKYRRPWWRYAFHELDGQLTPLQHLLIRAFLQSRLKTFRSQFDWSETEIK